MRCASVVSAYSLTVPIGSVWRPEHEEHHRLIARIHFLVRRRRGHLRRQLPRRLRDHRLHVLRGRIDVAAQIELQRDVGAALRAGRVDRLQPGNRGELLLERQRDRRGHRIGARAGQRGAHLNGGEVDRRQIADRELLIGERSEHEDAEHQQDRRDRARDEDRGEIHDPAFSAFVADRHLGAWGEPEVAVGDDHLVWLQPFRHDCFAADRSPDLDGTQFGALIPLITTNTYWTILPGLNGRGRGDDRIACPPTSVSTTFTNWPGHST